MRSVRYKAFISYSHTDKDFAVRLEGALQGFGKAWYQTRARRVFRDDSNIQFGSLREGVVGALEESEFYLLLASPAAAQSEWVAREADSWLRRHGTDNLLIVLARGSLVWDNSRSAYDRERTTALPSPLINAFSGEPLYADLSWAEQTQDLTLQNPEFKKTIAQLTATLENRSTEDMIGAEIEQHNRTRRIRNAAVTILSVLLVLAVVFAGLATWQTRVARRERAEALHRLYTLQLTRAQELVNKDPGRALDVLDDTLRTAGGLREFTWDLYRRLGDRTVLALGGMWNLRSKTSREAAPVLALSHDGSLLATASVRQAKRWEHSSRRFVTEILVWNIESGAKLYGFTLCEGRSQEEIRVEAISFAPDGRHLAASAGSRPSVVKVWDLATGGELMTAESELIEFLALAPSSPSFGVPAEGVGPLIGVQYFGDVVVWDPVGPKAEMRCFEGKPVGALAAGRSGVDIFTADPDEIVGWDVATGTRYTRPNPAGIQAYVVLSPDAERIASADYDTISVWRAASDRADWYLEWRLKGGHSETVRSVAFSPDGRTLASGGNDNTARLWDLERGIVTMTLRGPSDDVTALAFSGDGRRLSAGAADATVFVWDIAGQAERPTHRLEIANKPDCFDFSTESNTVVVAAEGRVLLRTLTGDHELAAFAGRGPRQCGISESGDTVFWIEGDSHVALWNVAEQQFYPPIGPVSDPLSVRLSPLGDVLAAFVGPDSIGVWEVKSGELEGTIKSEGELEPPLDFVDHTLLFGHVRKDGHEHLTLWDTKARKRLAALTIPPAAGPSTFAHCRERRLFASAVQENLRIVDLGAGTLLRDMPWYERVLFSANPKANKLAFSPDCETLVIGDDLGRISSWDVATGEPRFPVVDDAHTGPTTTETRGPGEIGVKTKVTSDGVTALAFAPDGRTIATGSGSNLGRGELKLWSADRGERFAELPATSGSVTSTKFSSDGTRLGIVLQPPSPNEPDSPSKVLELWSTSGSRQLGLLAAHDLPILRVKFSPDGEHLLTEGDQEAAKLWNVSRSGRLSESDHWLRIGAARWMSDDVAGGGKVARSPDGRFRVEVQDRFLLLYYGNDGVPRILKSDDQEHYFHTQPIQSIHMLSNGTLISFAQERRQAAEIVLWDLDAGRPMREAYEPGNLVTSLMLSPDEQIFVTIGAVGTVLDHPGFVHIWDTRDLRHVASLVGHRVRVTAAAFSPDRKRLATGDIDGFVRTWDLSNLDTR